MEGGALTDGCTVVQLFNVIQKAQAAKASEDKSKLALRGSGKPTLDAPKMTNKKRPIVAQKEGDPSSVMDDSSLTFTVRSNRQGYLHGCHSLRWRSFQDLISTFDYL